ncbi:FCD domain-containing protein [Fodinicola feengrottensis]|uniref:FCD domain-containing protein n=2 Tax=Fodinicola feengrottensis TaxID=435914 RepID=A0ABN2IS26_9ACTN
MHGQVVEWLGLRIVSGELTSGSQLPNEVELAAQLEVSRGGVREAVKALAAKGLVEPRPRLGTRVLPRADWNLMDREVIEWHGRAGDPDFLAHLLELRLVVEPGAAGLAAERASAAEVAALQAAYDGMAEHAGALPESEDDFVRADLAFHLILLRASGNQLIEQLGRLLETGLRHSLQTTSHLPGGVRATLPLHRAVLLAVQGHRPAAASRAMRRLIDTTAAAAAAMMSPR